MTVDQSYHLASCQRLRKRMEPGPILWDHVCFISKFVKISKKREKNGMEKRDMTKRDKSHGYKFCEALYLVSSLLFSNGRAVHYNGSSLLQWRSVRLDVTLDSGNIAGKSMFCELVYVLNLISRLLFSIKYNHA